MPKIFTCALCGNQAYKLPVVLMNGEKPPLLICERCNSLSGTCVRCASARTCPFETDPSPIPKTIQKQFRNGPMISVTEVKNPARIDITCKTSCPCFSEDFGCMKEYNTCGKYEVRYEQ